MLSGSALPRVIHLSLALLCSVAAVAGGGPDVETVLLPSCGLQPQAVYHGRTLHVVYFEGDPKAGDVVYLRSDDGGATFDLVRQVNSQSGSAVATGTIRGPQLSVDGDGRPHVVWNGSTIAEPRGPLNPEMPADNPHNGTPLLYARLGDDGRFEPQRNLMQKTWGLDGGATVAADSAGGVYVGWHGKADGAKKGEKGRRVWLASSSDHGRTFSAEREIYGSKTGACACCGMTLFAGPGGVAGLYRSARKIKHRDTYLFSANDPDRKFRGARLDEWEIAACPMSSMSLIAGETGLLAGWETAGQVLFTDVGADGRAAREPTAAGGEAKNRKHPRLARNSRGETLLVWTEVAGWGKPGAVRRQAFDAAGTPLGEPVDAGRVPPWSFGAVAANPDDTFTILR